MAGTSAGQLFANWFRARRWTTVSHSTPPTTAVTFWAFDCGSWPGVGRPWPAELLAAPGGQPLETGEARAVSGAPGTAIGADPMCCSVALTHPTLLDSRLLRPGRSPERRFGRFKRRGIGGAVLRGVRCAVNGWAGYARFAIGRTGTTSREQARRQETTPEHSPPSHYVEKP
jgi:hypothetical protein